MYFRCEDCCKVLGNTKLNVGNDLLLMGMSHFCYLLANSYSKSHERSEQSSHTEEDNKCQHISISRAFEFPSSVVRFTITKV